MRPIDLIVAIVAGLIAFAAYATIVELGGSPLVGFGAAVFVWGFALWSFHQPPVAPPDPPEDK